MYIYTGSNYRSPRRFPGISALAGIGNYSFGAVDDEAVVAPVVSDLTAIDVTPQTSSDILDAVITPTTSIIDVTTAPTETPVVLTDAQLELKKFGYFGSMPVSVGMQVMSIVGGVAGGLAGIIMGLKIANVTRVDTKEIILASALAAASAFVAIFAIRTFE